MHKGSKGQLLIAINWRLRSQDDKPESKNFLACLRGSILLNIHEVWPRPFWRGSSHQEKNTVDHFIGHIPFASFERDKRPDKINKKSREFEHFMP